MSSRCRVAVRLLCALLTIAGCASVAPAQTPAQLDHTPGPVVILTNADYESSAFQVHFPQGWRVITSAASLPPAVIFVRPDDAALMMFSVEPADIPALPGTEVQPRTQVREVMLDHGLTLYAAIAAPAADWEDMLRLFDLAAASLEAVPEQD
jgi:hypothetical protein